jgi:hypothetical protein
MANELTLTSSITHTKAPKISWRPSSNFTADQTGTGVNIATLSIGTSEEDVDFTTIFPDLTTAGIVVIENLDATNYVEWGVKDTTMKAIGRIEAGDFPVIFRYKPAVVLRMQANTAACICTIWVYED